MSSHARRRLTRALQQLPPTPVAPLPVRAITPADAEALATLMYDGYAGTLDFEPTDTVETARSEIAGYFADERGRAMPEHSFVALDAGQPVAATLVLLFRGTPLLGYAFTAKRWQGRGLSSRLVWQSMVSLRCAGYASLDLFVTVGNAPAERVYAKFGFIEVPRA